MDRYADRQEAGRVLATALATHAHQPNTLILALPRGGVPVAYEIAKALALPLDIFIARKLGVPHQEELAMGAIAMGGISVLNERIIRELNISPATIKRVTEAEQQELERRLKVYRGNLPLPAIKDQTLLVVDDGIATGATMRAVIKALRGFKPSKIIVAVPVAEKSMCDSIADLVDQLICPMQPLYFNAVGNWYEHFEQTSDEEVIFLLKKSALSLATSKGSPT